MTRIVHDGFVILLDDMNLGYLKRMQWVDHGSQLPLLLIPMGALIHLALRFTIVIYHPSTESTNQQKSKVSSPGCCSVLFQAVWLWIKGPCSPAVSHKVSIGNIVRWDCWGSSLPLPVSKQRWFQLMTRGWGSASHYPAIWDWLVIVLIRVSMTFW